MTDIKILIVDPEAVITNIHRSYIQEVGGFTLIGIGKNQSEVFELLARKKPDLVIINDCVSDSNTIEVISFARTEELPIDFIIITEITDGIAIHWALRHGIFDYILKPFKFDRLQSSLLSYREFWQQLTCKSALSQRDLDGYKLKKSSLQV
ncbi:response regulator [Pelosinus sp. IPA-1]|uniref:response regulator n=1 Tax=Pelosinus sp. IPA-1 TaxID=3029569 RepID=UPI0024362A8E|nr:response regulator [Pelosinus sp. IPA-1]GMA97334.1 hypothetical protein PIPA1_01340 [Pelosinus sp. IPA-1]